MMALGALALVGIIMVGLDLCEIEANAEDNNERHLRREHE